MHWVRAVILAFSTYTRIPMPQVKMGDIPGGDSVSDFKERCCETFKWLAEVSAKGTTAFVIHGGNIMAILEKFALPKQDFYSYRIPNCGFIICRYENGALERKGGSL